MQLVTLIGAQDHSSERAAKGSFSLARAQTALPAVCTDFANSSFDCLNGRIAHLFSLQLFPVHSILRLHREYRVWEVLRMYSISNVEPS
jgi:hypothetical protein